jgi:hypothetical protein
MAHGYFAAELEAVAAARPVAALPAAAGPRPAGLEAAAAAVAVAGVAAAVAQQARTLVPEPETVRRARLHR